MVRNILSPADHERISDAIRKAERSTSGEIYCVLAQSSDSYFFPSAFFSAVAILISMVVAGLVMDTGWTALSAATLPLAGLAAFATALLLLALVPRLRIHLVPPALRYRRASSNAAKQFLSHNIHTTSGRTGVLIFVSLQERYAEIIADSEISTKVPQETWNAVVAGVIERARYGQLADGFIWAIETVGAELVRHFPGSDEARNELDDKLVEI